MTLSANLVNDEKEKNRKIDAAYNNVASQFSRISYARHIYLSHRAINANRNDNSEATQQLRRKTCKQL